MKDEEFISINCYALLKYFTSTLIFVLITSLFLTLIIFHYQSCPTIALHLIFSFIGWILISLVFIPLFAIGGDVGKQIKNIFLFFLVGFNAICALWGTSDALYASKCYHGDWWGVLFYFVDNIVLIIQYLTICCIPSGLYEKVLEFNMHGE